MRLIGVSVLNRQRCERHATEPQVQRQSREPAAATIGTHAEAGPIAECARKMSRMASRQSGEIVERPLFVWRIVQRLQDTRDAVLCASW